MPEEKNGGALTTLASIIPEAAYDIVARVLPGLVSIVAAYYLYSCFQFWILHQPIRWPALGKDDPIFGLFLLWAIACWTLGFILNPVGDFLSDRIGRPEILCTVAKRYPSVLLQANQRGILAHEVKEPLSVSTCDDLYQQLHEHLKDSRPDWRGLLLKIQAEMMFYANILAGLTIVLAGGLLSTGLAFVAVPIHWGTLGVVSILGWMTCSLIPVVLLGLLAWRELKDKYRQLWVRQLALLVADLQAQSPAVPTVPNP